MVILDEPVTDVYPGITEYASLAAAGTLDTYGTGIDARIDLSGYGVQNANSFVLNGNCAGQGFGYRTDQRAVINFILASAGDEADEIDIATA